VQELWYPSDQEQTNQMSSNGNSSVDIARVVEQIQLIGEREVYWIQCSLVQDRHKSNSGPDPPDGLPSSD
jgi:hypothetical protein